MKLPLPSALPVRTKLTVFTTLLCTFAVGLACVAFIAWDTRSFQRQLVAEESTLADVVGSNASAAIVFDDPNTALATLRGLASTEHVRAATLLRPDGTVFARYQRPHAPAGPDPVLAPGESRFTPDALLLRREIRDRGERVGAIVVTAELSALHERLQAIVLLGLLVFACTFLASLVLAARISHVFTRRLTELSAAARHVTAHRDWSRRVRSRDTDELGQVAAAFDEMLDETQRHQVELTHTQQKLQAHVSQLHLEIGEREKTQQALQRSEEMLVQAQKMEAVGKLAGGVAHDFNNILTAIRGYSELVLASLDPNSRDWRRVQEVVKASQRAAALTSQLLAFGRKQMLAPKVLDLAEVVQSMQRMLERIIGADVELCLVKRFGVGNVRADRSQIEQVVMNLIVNARDAMPEGGRVTIELSNAVLDEAYAATHLEVTPGRYVQLTVTDEGCGIDKESQSHIFEPFFTTKGQGKGTGLGLATVYGIVKQSGGHVTVYSEPGRGATFKVYLPLVSLAAEELTEAIPLVPLRGHETVLLVEDESQLRELLSEALREHGFVVHDAGDVAEAERVIEAHIGDLDIMVTDVVMPGGTGRQLADRLLQRRPGLPVLFMSGYSESAIVHRGVLEKGIEFLQKPFSTADLIRRVREVLGSGDSREAA